MPKGGGGRYPHLEGRTVSPLTGADAEEEVAVHRGVAERAGALSDGASGGCPSARGPQ